MGSYYSFRVLYDSYHYHRLDQALYRDPNVNRIVKMPFFLQMHHLSLEEPRVSAFCMFTGILAVVVFAFFLYQATFAVYGITTNESFKWGDAAYAIKTGYIEHIPKSVFDYNRDYRRLKLRAMASGLQSPAEKLLRKRTRAVANEMLLEESVGSGGMETTQSTSTLLSPDVVCQSKSEDAGNEGAPIAYYRASTHGKRMSNIYNLGLWRNIMDVVFPKPF
ncbi:hypothetical protein BASA62_008525 [Batrachochytrium salamandrivorans]|nr:hypothetical protein BASA62_008525 [Batrachochytrium salamandrivorans]